MVLSLWSVTMLSLYIRVQVNILGRHLYIDTARGLGSSHLLVSHLLSLKNHCLFMNGTLLRSCSLLVVRFSMLVFFLISTPLVANWLFR